MPYYNTILVDPDPPVTLFQTAPLTPPPSGQQLVSSLQWNNLISILDGTGSDAKIPNLALDDILYDKIQNVSATSKFLGRITAGAGVIEELSGTQATSLLNTFTDSLKGLAPASGGGTTNFLRADGTWSDPTTGSDTPWTVDHNAAGFNLDNVGVLISNAAIPSTDGTIRLGFGETIKWRASGNNLNVSLATDTSNQLTFYDGVSTGVVMVIGQLPPFVDFDSSGLENIQFLDDSFEGAISATVGFIRMQTEQQVAWRNVAGTLDNSIMFDANDAFAIQINELTEYFFGVPDADWLGHSLVNFDYLQSSGISPANTGTIRLQNEQSIKWRNAADTDDYRLEFDGSDKFLMNSGLEVEGNLTISSGGGIIGATDLQLTGFLSVDIGGGTAGAGVVRLPNDEAVAWRNAGDTTDLALLVNASDKLEFDGVEIATALTSTPRFDVKKSGRAFRGQANVFNDGILAGMSSTGTSAAGTRDAEGVWQRWTTGAVIDNQAGERQGTVAQLFRRIEHCYIRARLRLVSTTLLQFFLGFTSSANLVSADDEPLDGASGFGLCIISSSANWQIASNDGAGTTVFADTGVAWASTNVVTIELKADDGDTGFQWKINNGSWSSVITANVPASTQNLGYQHTITSNEAITAKAFEYNYVYVENDK